MIGHRACQNIQGGPDGLFKANIMDIQRCKKGQQCVIVIGQCVCWDNTIEGGEGGESPCSAGWARVIGKQGPDLTHGLSSFLLGAFLLFPVWESCQKKSQTLKLYADETR